MHSTILKAVQMQAKVGPRKMLDPPFAPTTKKIYFEISKKITKNSVFVNFCEEPVFFMIYVKMRKFIF
jgi:hypothetical protein